MDVLTFGEVLACFSRAVDPSAAAKGYYARTIGGAEANTAIGLARLGHDVTWISRVATDPLGDHVVETLAAEGVDLSHVVRAPDRQTGVMVKERYGAHDTSVHYYRRHSAATLLAPGDIPDELIASASIVHLTGVTLAIGERPRALAHELAARVGALGVPLSFDANFRPRLLDVQDAREQYAALLPHISWLFCNELEARLITGCDDAEDAVARLVDSGPTTVIVKRGAEGALAAIDGVRYHVRASPATHPIDPVGAGDAFNAGWIHSRLTGMTIEQGLDLAAFVAAGVVQHPGDYEGFPSAEIVAQWLVRSTADKEGVPG